MAGPPCAGKTTYVREHAGAGATVLDQDVIGSREMGRRLDRVHEIGGELWIIRSLPIRSQREAWARTWGCDQIVLLRPSRAVLVERAQRRPHPRATIAAIDAWIKAEDAVGYAPDLDW